MSARSSCREQFLYLNVEYFGEEFSLSISCDRTTGFDVREDIPCHVASQNLQLRDQIVLRPTVKVTVSDDFGSNYV
ncbi:MAG: hypothetical protein H7Y17_00695 [Chlorobia bacterium]|nr:hypothetical protein [Fimbriimonadaceae bacterium]